MLFFKWQKKFSCCELELKKTLNWNNCCYRFISLTFCSIKTQNQLTAENTFNLDCFILALLNSFIFIPGFEILPALSKPLWLIVILLSCELVVKVMFLCFESNATNEIETILLNKERVLMIWVKLSTLVPIQKLKYKSSLIYSYPTFNLHFISTLKCQF